MNYERRHLLIVTRSVLARKIEEYVPAIMPTESTNAKFFVASLPIKKRARSARSVVSEVFMERPMVCIILAPTVSANVVFDFDS